MKVELVTEENGGQIKYNRFKEYLFLHAKTIYGMA